MRVEYARSGDDECITIIPETKMENEIVNSMYSRGVEVKMSLPSRLWMEIWVKKPARAATKEDE